MVVLYPLYFIVFFLVVHGMTSSYATTSNQAASTCENSDTYTYGANPEMRCQAIRIKQERRETYCKDPEVHSFCPQTCGVCCEDDPDYRFHIPSKRNLKCKWLGRKDRRMKKWCKEFKNKKMVRDACPKACDFCFPFIAHDTQGPSSSATPSYSNKPSENPSKQTSTKPSPKQSSSPSEEHSSNPSLPVTVKSADDTSNIPMYPSEYPTYKPSGLPSPPSSATPSISNTPSHFCDTRPGNQVPFTLLIQSDSNPTENSFKLFVHKNGDWEEKLSKDRLQRNQLNRYDMCLFYKRCFRFELYDSAGDGIDGGYYTILFDGVEVAYYELDSGYAVVQFGGINCEPDILQANEGKNT